MVTNSDPIVPRASLSAVSGPYQGATIDLPIGEIIIGSSRGCTPLLREDPGLSPRHAKVIHDPPGAVAVEDLSSLNGTRLNGSPVTSPTLMRAGDTITVGGSTLRLQISVPQSTTALAPKSGEHITHSAPESLESSDTVIQQARASLESGDLAQSEALFWRLLQDPEQVAAGLYGIGYLRLKTGDLGTAETFFKGCLRFDPGHANALFQLGFIAERQGFPVAACEWYNQATSVNPQHQGACARLDALAGANGEIPSEDYRQNADGDIPEESPRIEVGVHGDVYELLKNDHSIISGQAVAIMDDLVFDKRPAFIAYLGAYVWRVLGLFLIGLLIFRWIFLVVGPILLVPFYLHVISVRIRLKRGRLQLEHGLFRRQLKNIDISRIRDVNVDRRLVHRMTGDGVLVVNFAPVSGSPKTWLARRRNVVRVIGLARGECLIEIHQKLLSLIFLLQGNPILKGITQ